MNYEWLLARRYLWSKRRHPFAGVMSATSIVGITVGVAALVIVMAVMNGFDEELKKRIIGTQANLVIEKDGGLTDWHSAAAAIKKNKSVEAAAPFVQGQALVQSGEDTTGVLVRGVDPHEEKSVTHFEEYLERGTLEAQGLKALPGLELARRLHLDIGSKISVLAPGAKAPMHFEVSGFFQSGLYEYDANILFLNLESAQTLFGLGESSSGLTVRLNDADKALRLKTELQSLLGSGYFVRTWVDSNRTLFGALRLEKLVMFLILALIILVASLNVGGSLTILVMDKTKDIGILKALGAAPSNILKIFTTQGILVGTLGAGAGLLLGLGVCWVLSHFSFIELPREIYYMEKLPVAIDWNDTLRVALVALGLSAGAAIYPAVSAARLPAAKALRYE